MADYVYAVTVTADSPEEAAQVMAERLNHDEDYGFDYTVGFEPMEQVVEEGPRQWVVTGTSMVVEAETWEDAILRAEQSSGWHWEAKEVTD